MKFRAEEEASSPHANRRQHEAQDACERELHFILDPWLSSIFSNSSQHNGPLLPLSLLTFLTLSPCLSHSCTLTLYVQRYSTHTFHLFFFTFLYSKTLLPPLVNDVLSCWLLVCATVPLSICCSSNWRDEEEKYAPVIQLTFGFANLKIPHKPLEKVLA